MNFSVIRIELLLAVKTVHLKGLSKTNLPDCFQFDITVSSAPFLQHAMLYCRYGDCYYSDLFFCIIITKCTIALNFLSALVTELIGITQMYVYLCLCWPVIS